MASSADLEKKRQPLMKKITRDQLIIANWDPNSVSSSELELMSVGLKEHKIKLGALFDETVMKLTDAEFASHETDFFTVSTALTTIQVKVMDLVRAAAQKTPTNQLSVKLERVKLPKFSGNFCDWQSFHDLFMTSVLKNPNLSGVEKMVHLKSCLTGEAASIISSFQATEANYKEAWASLTKRFNNKREIIFSHLRKFDEAKFMIVESGPGLRSLCDTINDCVRSLKVLKVPVDKWDLILIYFGMKKLDPETRKQWSLDQDADLPTLEEFTDFLEARAKALTDAATTSSKKTTESFDKKKSSLSHHGSQSSSSVPSCLKCSDSHRLVDCKAFSSLPTQERKNFVVQNNLCYNCLHKGHSVSQCQMKFSCKKCGKRHHTLLHIQPQQSTRSSVVLSHEDESKETTNILNSSSSLKSDPSLNSTHCTNEDEFSKIVLLGTLLVTADDSSREKRNCRVFLDPGSEINLISERCIDALGLKRRRTCVNISGIGGAAGGQSKGLVSLRLFSRVRDFNIVINAHVLPKITGLLPRVHCKSSWPHIKNLELSDSNFNTPGSIDILIGAEFAASLMFPEVVHGPPGTPTAQNTQFGWMLSGSAQESLAQGRQASSHHVCCSISSPCLESTIEKFWKLEEAEPDQIPLSKEDKECEEHFINTHQRNEDGGFTVQLPFKNLAPCLGSSRETAAKRFYKLESRLAAQPKLREAYVKDMRESIKNKIMELIQDNEINIPQNNSYYMPHSVVIKETSSTTKYRIVFDASAKTSTGVSLNEVLMTGTKLQIDLVPLFIRFRFHIIAMSADIVKFYKQYHVTKRDADFQRLWWRESPQHQLQHYRMVRLTFGVTAAEFLAIRCLKQLAEEEKKKFPIAASVIK